MSKYWCSVLSLAPCGTISFEDIHFEYIINSFDLASIYLSSTCPVFQLELILLHGHWICGILSSWSLEDTLTLFSGFIYLFIF